MSTSSRHTSELKEFVALLTTQGYVTKLTQASNGQTLIIRTPSHPALVKSEPASQDMPAE
ncbi:MAG: hypothetical protein ACRYG7_45320 [Janthinobacterium lividum]